MAVMAVLTLLVAASGCSTVALYGRQAEAGGSAQLFNRDIENVAVEMTSRLREFDPTDRIIAVTTFLSLDNFEETSSFGRYVAEELSSQLFKRGFRLREIRQRLRVKVTPGQGEVALSRDADEILRNQQVDAVVTGSYARFGNQVVVNVRMIDVDTARVVSVAQLVVDDFFGGPVEDLLRSGRPGRGVVVPVIPMKPGV